MPEFIFCMLCAALGFITGIAVGLSFDPSDKQREVITCEYEGGAYKEDVCIRDGRVIELEKR